MNWKSPGQAKTPNELLRDAFGKTKRKSKYRNEPTEVDRRCDGYSFQSQLEREVYFILKMRQRVGELEILQVQDHVYLSSAEIEYIADFKCRDLENSEIFWVEAKGFEKPEWRIKLRLWRVYGPGKLEVWKGDHTRPFLHETVVSKSWIEENAYE